MKIALVSDLHLEFWTQKTDFDRLVEKLNSLDVDLVVNAGDIHPLPKHRGLFAAQMNKPYMQVLGNHDFYGKQNALASYNVDVRMIGGVKVLGCTLWTDFNKADPITMFHFKHALADGWQIVPVNFKTLAEEVYDIHQFHLKRIAEEKPDIVVTHHAPSLQTVHPTFQDDRAMNYYFCSDLDKFILDNQNIKYWLYGHTHRDVDANVGQTKVRSRQLGYPSENYSSVDKYQPLVVEV